MAELVLRNRIRREGVSQFLLRVSVLALLNILLLSALFTTASGSSFEFDTVARQYGYFVPLLVLSAAVGSWEIELFAGIGESYLQHPKWMWPTRLLVTLVECLVPVAFFAVITVTAGGPDVLAHLFTMALMAVSFGMLGTSLGFCIGFRHEKAVNNFVNLAPWLLGFGPGPYFGNDAFGLSVIFPGGHSNSGEFGYEWIKEALVVVLAIVLFRLGSRARKRRFFSR
ncbi:hypothetical protein [Streptomyces muensis]|uniref:Uncharacterized protein n=1 Tax=Streptomyces muensis TaxID=1077944 RepID=A0A9X1TPQ6_STRM4|nr:hypothetical protein [Streptomyces muensis]MCF1598465.1 hypothetical protein [Streptomyces muensis]